MQTLDPERLDALLSRRQTALALSEAGYQTAEKTLAAKAVRGGGPPFRKYGRAVLYRWGDALAWAEARLSAPATSTSEIQRRNE